jgi:hypothetical protein
VGFVDGDEADADLPVQARDARAPAPEDSLGRGVEEADAVRPRRAVCALLGRRCDGERARAERRDLPWVERGGG